MIQILPIPNKSIHLKLTFWVNTFNSGTLNLSRVSENIPSLPGRRLEKDRHVPRRSDAVHFRSGSGSSDPLLRIMDPLNQDSSFDKLPNFRTVLSVLALKWEAKTFFKTKKDLDRVFQKIPNKTWAPRTQHIFWSDLYSSWGRTASTSTQPSRQDVG